mmetsp:Transcript_3769/g.8040  ORF Transcript_3769/g.8040 Transcript_3769/m.8040 type:complete len:80 (-) Transcript_3769:3700-3939(-)
MCLCGVNDSTSNETWVGNEETLDAGTSPRTFRSMAMLILTIRNKLLSLSFSTMFLDDFNISNVCVCAGVGGLDDVVIYL